jgi:hypothetical protein
VLYLALKLAHLVAVILWIGPPLGAYAVLGRALKERHGDVDGGRARLIWVERQVERVLVLEHIAFPVLIASGIGMVWFVGVDAALQWTWLKWKLAAVAFIVAFEVFDIYVSHVVWPPVLRADDPWAHASWPRAKAARRRLALAAVPVALVFIPATLWLAVVKPG